MVWREHRGSRSGARAARKATPPQASRPWPRTGVMRLPLAGRTREATIEAMEAAPPWERDEMSYLQVVELTEVSAIVVYRVTAQRPRRDPFSAALSSPFVLSKGIWKLAFHQRSPTA